MLRSDGLSGVLGLHLRFRGLLRPFLSLVLAFFNCLRLRLFGRLVVRAEGVQGVQIQLQEPGEAVLVHHIDLLQFLHDEVEQASVVSRRRVLPPGFVQFGLRDVGRLLLGLDLVGELLGLRQHVDRLLVVQDVSL